MDHCHFIGIGGIGMSGLASLMLKQNCKVSGSDIALSALTEGLVSQGVEVLIGHNADNIKPSMTVIYTTGLTGGQVELDAAKKFGCKLLHRSEMLAYLMKGHKSLAVTGTHGKTTTSSLLSWVLKKAGVDPTYAIGGIVKGFESNANFGRGEYFVAEACESDGSFLNYTPFGAIFTNIDNDHLDYYKTLEALELGFKKFGAQVQNNDLLFWCIDDARLKSCALKGVSYGFHQDAACRVLHAEQQGWQSRFDFEFQGKNYSDVIVNLTGRHNVQNAVAVFGLCLSLGLDEDKIREGLMSFPGVKRRADVRFDKHSVLMIDDYAHHPTEIKAALKAIRKAIGERRLIALHQPHRYTRTRDCLELYEKSFDDADHLILSEIYSANEAPIEGLDETSVLKALQGSALRSIEVVKRREMAKHLMQMLRPNDVVVSIGAGDITHIGKEIEELLKKGLKPLNVGIVFGGVSCEHEISKLSADFVSENISRQLYNVSYFAIGKNGHFGFGQSMQLASKNAESSTKRLTEEIFQAFEDCDVLFPVLHGPYGEDGTIQGFFEMLGKAYIGCDHTSSAICMNKAISKNLMLLKGVPTAPFYDFGKNLWQSEKEEVLEAILHHLHYPLFVKPVHLGSSIGVKKVHTVEELVLAIDAAFEVDTHLLVEQGIKNPREIEFAVIGNDDVRVFPPGEILTNGEVYTFEKKYSDQALPATPKAILEEELILEGCELAKRAYEAIGCSGMARIDFFLDKEKRFWLNELNPIPGMTKNSLFPSIAKENGISAEALINKLIVLALHKFKAKNVLTKYLP